MKEDLLMFHGVAEQYLAAFKQKVKLEDLNAPIFFSEHKNIRSGDRLYTYDAADDKGLVMVRSPSNWVLVGVRQDITGEGEKSREDEPKNKKELVPTLSNGDVIRVRLFDKYMPEPCVIVELNYTYALFSPVNKNGIYPPLFNVYAKGHSTIENRMINDPMFELI